MTRLAHVGRTLLATLRLCLANQFRYPLEWITQTISNLGLLMLLIFGLRHAFGVQDANNTGATLLFSLVAMAGLQGPVRYLENKSGDLEDLFLTPLPAPVLLFCHATAQLVLMMINVIFCYVALVMVFHLPFMMLAYMLQGVPAVFLGMLGFGYLLAGLQLLFKRLGGLMNLLAALLVALAFVPQGWLKHLVWVSPYVSGLLALRGGTSAMLSAYGLGLVQLTLGLIAFGLAERAMVHLGLSGMR